MGYTHYWTFKEPLKIKGEASRVEAQHQLAVRQCHRIILAWNKHAKSIDLKHPNRLSGFSAHTKLRQYGGLDFNGTGDLGHENFSLREHYKQNLEESFNFCKTAHKPYDAVVVACLITLKYYLGDLIQVDSDGDKSDWVNGLELARSVLRIKKLQIPVSIRDAEFHLEIAK